MGADLLGRRGLAPMDAALNLPAEHHSHGVRRSVADVCARGSHDEVVERLAKRTGVRCAVCTCAGARRTTLSVLFAEGLQQMLELALIIAFFEAGYTSGQSRGYMGPTSGGFVLVAYFAGAWSSTMVATDGGVILILAMLLGSLAACAALILLRVLPHRNLREVLDKKTYFPYRLTGTLILLIGIYKIIDTLAHFSFTSVFSAVILLLLTVDSFNYCFYVHRRKNVPNIDEVTRDDPRPVVLFLRSFALDQKHDAENATFQERIGPELFVQVGPFVAFGNPDEPLPTTGAAKDFIQDESWIQEMQRRIDSAAIILIAAGEGKGLRAELAYIANHKDPTRVFMITPPEELVSPVTRLVFYNMLMGMGWRLPKEVPGPNTLMHW